MPQLSYAANMAGLGGATVQINASAITFFPWTPWDSISLKTINMAITHISSASLTFSLGLYSLNVGTLSLANSASATSSSNNVSGYYVSLTATSATQNITPGTWFWGILVSTSGNSNVAFYGNATALLSAGNAFPGAFIGGNQTASTNALPASIATSDLATNSAGAFGVPYIILSS